MVSETTPMFSRKDTTHDGPGQSALLEVLDVLKAAEVDDRIRQAAETIYQALIEAELSSVIGDLPHERTGSCTAHRNGHLPRVLASTAGDLELRIPKLRSGSFFPSLLERRRRVDPSLFAVIMEAYLRGTSTRKVDDLVKALDADSGISKSEVSRICADLDTEVAAFRDRSLAAQHFPYVFVWCCLTRTDLPGGGDAGTSRPMQVASLPTVGGRATLQVMMRAVRRMQAAVDQARADLPDRQGSRKGFPCRRPAAAGSVGAGWR